MIQIQRVLKVALRYNKYLKSKDYTFHHFLRFVPVATCGDWQHGWTRLIQFQKVHFDFKVQQLFNLLSSHVAIGNKVGQYCH